jgi:hypothetical protein
MAKPPSGGKARGRAKKGERIFTTEVYPPPAGTEDTEEE